MSVIQDKAALIVTDVVGSGSAPSPTPVNPTNLITNIIAIITDVLKTFLLCGQTPAAVAASMNNPTRFQRRVFYRTVRRHSPTVGMEMPIFNSSLKVSATLHETDVTAMLAEAK